MFVSFQMAKNGNTAAKPKPSSVSIEDSLISFGKIIEKIFLSRKY